MVLSCKRHLYPNRLKYLSILTLRHRECQRGYKYGTCMRLICMISDHSVVVRLLRCHFSATNGNDRNVISTNVLCSSLLLQLLCALMLITNSLCN